jgi:hypothetical protein
MMKKDERIKQYIKTLNNISIDDIEALHSNADSLLCDLLREIGYGEVVDVYENIDFWYA